MRGALKCKEVFPRGLSCSGRVGSSFPAQPWCCLAHLWPFPCWNLELTLDTTAG